MRHELSTVMRRAAFGTAITGSLAVSVPGVPAYAAAGTAVVRVSFPSSVAGSAYLVSGPLDLATMARPTVARGVVGAGAVTFTVRPEDLTRPAGFSVTAARWVDQDHAAVSRADIGLAASQLDRSTYTVKAGAPITTVAWHTAAEVMAARPYTTRVSTESLPGQANVAAVLPRPALAPGAVRDPGPVPPVPALPTATVHTVLGKVVAWNLPLPADEIAQLTQALVDAGNSPVVSHNAYPGIQALRGISVHPVGSVAHAELTSSSQQVWQIGVSYDGKPFTVTGTAAHDKTTSQTDTWPDRPDCYYPPSTFDSGNCATYNGVGAMNIYGRDQWYVDDEVAEIVNWTSGDVIYLRDDKVYNDTYIGGTEYDLADSEDNFYLAPHAIRAGMYGAWASYLPGSTTTVHLNDSFEYSEGATVAIPGGPSFTSTMKQNHTYAVTNTIVMRPTSEVGVATFYRYDMGDSVFKHEYWSCELAPGWTKTPGTVEHAENPCYLNGG
jgi:hypothetical protein